MESTAELFCEFIDDYNVEVVDFSTFWNIFKQQERPDRIGAETWQEMKYFFGKVMDICPKITDAEPVVLTFKDRSKARYDHLYGDFQPIE